MTVHDDIAKLRRALVAARDFLNRLSLNDGASQRAKDREFIGVTLIPEALLVADGVETEIARLGRLADDRLALMKAEETGWQQECDELKERAEAAEAEAARLRDGLRLLIRDAPAELHQDAVWVDDLRELLADQDGAA